MPHRLRKTRKMRGSRTCGYGRVGQHRDQGSKGFRKSGRHKRGWSWVLRYEPDYFGKNGFTSPKSLRQKAEVINVGKLDEMARKLPVEKGEAKLLIDLEKMGYTKLLGTGKISRPLIVRVPSFSKSAAGKIEEAGGLISAKTEEKGG